MLGLFVIKQSTFNFTILMRRIFLCVTFLITGIMISCEKVVNFKPLSKSPLMVVEATIENGQAPVVILSRSLDYFSKITPDLLASSFVHEAVVEVSNGSKTHRLKEYSILNVNGYTLYYYSIDSSALSTAFVGEFNKSYSLKISKGVENVTASTTIPPVGMKVDSLWWIPPPPTIDSVYASIMTRITDPRGLGNCIRYFTKVNSGNFLPPRISTFNDQVIDGTTYDIRVEKGINRNDTIDFKTFNYFKRGDTVTFKYCNIDLGTYDFWRTMEYNYSSIGNPFSSPTRVLSNIKGGLGYFGGYAAQYTTVIIPK
jgi:hypothetical protein